MQYYRQARTDLKHVQGGRVGAGHNQAGNGHHVESLLTARPLPRSQGACHTHSASSKLP